MVHWEEFVGWMSGAARSLNDAIVCVSVDVVVGYCNDIYPKLKCPEPFYVVMGCKNSGCVKHPCFMWLHIAHKTPTMAHQKHITGTHCLLRMTHCCQR